MPEEYLFPAGCRPRRQSRRDAGRHLVATHAFTAHRAGQLLNRQLGNKRVHRGAPFRHVVEGQSPVTGKGDSLWQTLLNARAQINLPPRHVLPLDLIAPIIAVRDRFYTYERHSRRQHLLMAGEDSQHLLRIPRFTVNLQRL